MYEKYACRHAWLYACMQDHANSLTLNYSIAGTVAVCALALLDTKCVERREASILTEHVFSIGVVYSNCVDKKKA